LIDFIIRDGLWDAGICEQFAKNLFVRHNDGIIRKINNNNFFI